jgi:hypothetical protein
MSSYSYPKDTSSAKSDVEMPRSAIVSNSNTSSMNPPTFLDGTLSIEVLDAIRKSHLEMAIKGSETLWRIRDLAVTPLHLQVQMVTIALRMPSRDGRYVLVLWIHRLEEGTFCCTSCVPRGHPLDLMAEATMKVVGAFFDVPVEWCEDEFITHRIFYPTPRLPPLPIEMDLGVDPLDDIEM